MEQWLSLWSLGQKGVKKDFERIRNAGFDGVEVWAEHQCSMEYMEYAKDNDLKIGLHLPFHDLNLASPDTVVGDRTLSVNTEWLQRLAEYNGEHAVLHGGYAWASEERTEALQRVAERLGILAGTAKQNHVDLLLENLIPDKLNYSYIIASNVKEWASLVHNTKVQACLDTGHLAVMGASFQEAFEELGDRLASIHYSDNDAVSDLHQLPGEGKNVVSGLFEVIEQRNYQGPIVYEINPYKYSLNEILQYKTKHNLSPS